MNQATTKQNWISYINKALWNNSYQCAHCGNEWSEIWDSKIAMHCECCGIQNIEPCVSEKMNGRA